MNRLVILLLVTLVGYTFAQDLETAFKLLDTDGKRGITIGELVNVMGIEMGQTMFEKANVNHNRIIESHELSTFMRHRSEEAAALNRFLEAFKLLDKNRDGVINAFETQAEMGPAMLQQADVNHNKIIEFDELSRFMASKTNEVAALNSLLNAFKLLDTDGNSGITIEELEGVMGKEMGSRMFQKAGIKNDETITLEEFSKMMAGETKEALNQFLKH